MYNDIIGAGVTYSDYLGIDRHGTIIGVEPYPHDQSIVYIYIEDDDIELNIHQDTINNKIIRYS